MIERSFFAWKTGHPRAFWFSGLLEAKSWGQSSSVDVLRSCLIVAWGKGTSWRTKYDTASLLIRNMGDFSLLE